MTEDTQSLVEIEAAFASTPQLSAAALRDWGVTVESVLRGLAHDLNNRAVALSGIMELARDPVAEDAVELQSILSQELARVTELGLVLRSIAQPRAPIEAFSPADAAPDVMAIVALHPAHREFPVVIDASRASPVRVARWMFVRALVALASNGAVSTGSSPRISVADEGDWVVARLEGATIPVSQLSPYAAELARSMGGEPLEDGAAFRVPSLAALRRREGR